jgi:RimJ/RimL family protein N-acetyltransferase
VPAAAPTFAAAPTIESERLVLRGHRPDDLDACAAMWGDPAITRHIGGRPFSREETWFKILRYAGHWALCGFGYWVVIERDSGRLVGEVGIADFKRDLAPPLEGAPEVGGALARWAHGQGFATEAVGAALAWGERHLGRRRLVCLIEPANHASIRVADKCGFRPVHRTLYKGEPTIVFAR